MSKKNSEAKVSIVTATYNDGLYIRDCYNSVIGQSYSNWEWIIVDNGSTDEAAQILETISDSRVKVIHLEHNLGVSAGRNVGIDQSKGDFICFLDGDDILPPKSLSARLKIFDLDTKHEFVDGKVIAFSKTPDSPVDTYVPNFEGNPLQELLALSGKVFRGNTWMIKRVPGKTYAFREELAHGEELVLYIELSATGTFAYTTEPVLFYRQRTNSAMSNVEGLNTGYLQISKVLGKMKHVSHQQVAEFKSRARMIMFKTYLKAFRPIGALRSFLKFTSA